MCRQISARTVPSRDPHSRCLSRRLRLTGPSPCLHPPAMSFPAEQHPDDPLSWPPALTTALGACDGLQLLLLVCLLGLLDEVLLPLPLGTLGALVLCGLESPLVQDTVSDASHQGGIADDLEGQGERVCANVGQIEFRERRISEHRRERGETKQCQPLRPMLEHSKPILAPSD